MVVTGKLFRFVVVVGFVVTIGLTVVLLEIVVAFFGVVLIGVFVVGAIFRVFGKGSRTSVTVA